MLKVMLWPALLSLSLCVGVGEVVIAAVAARLRRPERARLCVCVEMKGANVSPLSTQTCK